MVRYISLLSIVTSFLLLPFAAYASDYYFGRTTFDTHSYSSGKDSWNTHLDGDFTDYINVSPYFGSYYIAITPQLGYYPYTDATGPCTGVSDCVYGSTPVGGASNVGFPVPFKSSYDSSVPPDGYYTMWFLNSAGSSTIGHVDFSYTNSQSPGVLSLSSRIVTVTPANNATAATSSPVTLAATGYTNLFDWVAGTHVTISIQPESVGVIATAAQYGVRTFDFSVGSENFSVSTTTILTEQGIYLMSVSIRHPSSFLGGIFSYFGIANSYNAEVIVATSTRFTAGALSSLDRALASTTQLFADRAASSTSFDLSGCSPVTFDFLGCISTIFGWPTGAASNALSNTNAIIFSYAPFGYISRFMVILSSPATSSFAGPSYTFAADYPVSAFAGQTFSFDFQSALASASDLENNQFKSTGADPKTLWEIIQVFYDTILGLILLYMIFHDLNMFGRDMESKGNWR